MSSPYGNTSSGLYQPSLAFPSTMQEPRLGGPPASSYHHSQAPYGMSYHGGSNFPTEWDAPRSEHPQYAERSRAFGDSGFSPETPTDDAASMKVKPKRRRADADQLKVLNEVLERTMFPTTEERNALAKQLGMTPRSVQIWYVLAQVIAQYVLMIP
jgi:hypothetical protein